MTDTANQLESTNRKRRISLDTYVHPRDGVTAYVITDGFHSVRRFLPDELVLDKSAAVSYLERELDRYIQRTASRV